MLGQPANQQVELPSSHSLSFCVHTVALWGKGEVLLEFSEECLLGLEKGKGQLKFPL